MCDLALALALSAHIGLEGDYNAVHPAIMCDGEGPIAGLYLNSESRVSAYAGINVSRGDWWAEIGVATGYSSAEIVPFARVGVDLGDGVSLFAAPAYEVWNGEERIGAVVGIEITVGDGKL